MDWDIYTLLISKPPSRNTLPKSDDTCLAWDDNHQGETRTKAQI
jgi:hypothetical protein